MTLMELLGMERLQRQTGRELEILRQETRAAQASPRGGEGRTGPGPGQAGTRAAKASHRGGEGRSVPGPEQVGTRAAQASLSDLVEVDMDARVGAMMRSRCLAAAESKWASPRG